jgi:uncharacterized membrane protein
MMASGSLPLPPASILSEYNQAFPGLVEKIIFWTEEQRKHRQLLERQRAERVEGRSNFFVGTYVGGCRCYFCNPWAAGVIAIVSIGGPTAAIWLARIANVSKSSPVSASVSPRVTPPLPTSNARAAAQQAKKSSD